MTEEQADALLAVLTQHPYEGTLRKRQSHHTERWYVVQYKPDGRLARVWFDAVTPLPPAVEMPPELRTA